MYMFIYVYIYIHIIWTPPPINLSTSLGGGNLKDFIKGVKV